MDCEAVTKLIDIGCFNGDSVLRFAPELGIDEIEAYDPNDSFKRIWGAIIDRYPFVTFHNKAVYTHNGSIEYTQRPDNYPLGSTIMKQKSGWGDGEVRKVECVDIADIVNEDCIIKLDAEGAEYDILERLIETGKDNLVKTLYVEWHDNKMSTDNKQRQEDLFKHFGDRVKQWQ